MPCFFAPIGPQVEAQKSKISLKICVQSRLERRLDRRSHKSFEKRRHRRVQEPIFEANAVQHAYHACALRPNIYRSAWPSAVCCAVVTCKPHDIVFGARWAPKMTPKVAPYGPQDAVRTRSTSNFIVLEVASKTKPCKERPPSPLPPFSGCMLAPGEEGREVGKPTTHAVYD